MSQKPTFNRKKTTTLSLNYPCYFFEETSDSPEPNVSEYQSAYFCYAEQYAPSIKDIDILNAHGVNQGTTIIIRNPFGDFQPTLDHSVKVDNKLYKIVDIQPQGNLIKLVLNSDV